MSCADFSRPVNRSAISSLCFRRSARSSAISAAWIAPALGPVVEATERIGHVIESVEVTLRRERLLLERHSDGLLTLVQPTQRRAQVAERPRARNT